MAKLELEIVGYNDALDNMLINGKKQKFTNNKIGGRTCTIEADKAEVVVYRTHNYIGKYWFWWSLLFYFVSIFGIFDSKANFRCLVVDFRFNVKLEKDKKITLKIQNFEDGGKFAEIENEEEVEILNNVQFIDKEAIKRKKKFKKVKFAISFLTILLTAAICVLINRR